jgi:hypothetical protein
MEKKPYRKSGLGERGLFPLIFAHAKVAKVGKGVVPRLRDTLPRATAVAGHAPAWIFLRPFHFRKGLGRPRRSSVPGFGVWG